MAFTQCLVCTFNVLNARRSVQRILFLSICHVYSNPNYEVKFRRRHGLTVYIIIVSYSYFVTDDNGKSCQNVSFSCKRNKCRVVSKTFHLPCSIKTFWKSKLWNEQSGVSSLILANLGTVKE